jgi:hypothetical protein
MKIGTNEPDQRRQLMEAHHLLLSRHVDELVQGLTIWLRDPADRGAWGLDASDAVHARAAGMVESFLDALVEGPEGFVFHVQGLAPGAGQGVTGLRNVWLGLTLFEDRIWRITTQEVPLEHQVPLLSWVTQTIGAAKDRLACELFARLDRYSRSDNERWAAQALLARGTDPGPEDDDPDELPAAAIR